MMLHHYFCFVLLSSILIKKGLKNFLLKKKTDLCCFGHPYDFRAWLDGVHDFRKCGKAYVGQTNSILHYKGRNRVIA